MNAIPYILLAWAAVGTLFSVHRPTSLYALLNLATCIGLYWLAAKGVITRRVICRTVTAVLLVNVALGLAQAWWGVTWIPQAVPPAGLMSNQNLLGSLIVVALPVIWMKGK